MDTKVNFQFNYNNEYGGCQSGDTSDKVFALHPLT